MSEFEKTAKILKALAHPLRLKIIRALTMEGEDMYLTEIGKRVGVSRALAKIHLKKLEAGAIVKSRIVLVEGEARALRYYHLQDFHIQLSPEIMKEVKYTGN